MVSFPASRKDGHAMSDVRVRFAPSPTGKLHIGGARTAIYNWAFARATGGTFVLRIEDTDPERSTKENIDLIIRALKWMGLDWDEGPGIGGEYGPYLQTERTKTYIEALEKLKENGSTYPCFCTAEELAARREAVQAGASPQPDPCRCMAKDEAQALIDSGKPHVWRLKVPEDRGTIVVHDVVHGDAEFDASLMDDMILVRSDGTPTYNFAVVCDDVNMKMTHIIRGDDHLSNTPRQVLVYEALGYPTPVFAHLPMICGPDGKKLSKRHGAASVEEYRDMGYLPDALFNYLALLGWAPDGETTLFTREEMADKFTLEHIGKNPSSLDYDKLEWINGQYIQHMGADAFAKALVPYLIEAGYADDEAQALALKGRIESIYPLVAERVKLMTQAVPMMAYLLDETVELDEKSVQKVLLKPGNKARSVLVSAEEALRACDWTAESIEAALRELPDKLDLKARLVFQPIRVAVCGNMVSPPLFESIELLDEDVVMKRLQDAALIAVD